MLAEFLPIPRIVYDGGLYRLDYDRPQVLGKFAVFMGMLLFF
jgi:hypothetical protein